MKRRFLGVLLSMGFARMASAHFVFIVPQPGGATAQLILSEDLKPSEEVEVDMIGGTRLAARDAAGHETALHFTKDGRAYLAKLAQGTQLIHGVTDPGVMQHGQDKPYVLMYYSKTILGDALSSHKTIGKEAPVEIVPEGKPGAVTLELLVHGRPQPNAEVTVIFPDGTQRAIKTDSTGHTEVLKDSGRFAAWARSWEPGSGESAGKKYEQVRNYATLVFDIPQKASAVPASPVTRTARFATLPQAASSFGAVVSDGWLYVYGGHVAPTHSYSTASVSGRFNRLKLLDKVASDQTWEQLPAGPPVQGMNLVAFENEVYRTGGMEPRNAPDKPQDINSIADVARFNSTTSKWETITPLPVPRSSHDAVIIGEKLIVVGGWTLRGTTRNIEFRDNLEILDLKAEKPVWKSAGQPFKRRAMVAAAMADRMYVIGGFDDKENISRDVDIYDPKTDKWTKGPQLPDGENGGFAPAACVHDGKLYVSVADGSLYRLNEASQQWDKAGKSTPRLAHRIVSFGDRILVIGGAADGDNSDLIEAIPIGGR